MAQNPRDNPNETSQQKEQGAATFLSMEERQQVKRFLNYPEDFPERFMPYIQDWLNLNGLDIPITQIRGFSQFKASYSQIANTGFESTSSTAYTDLTTPGPSLTGLGDGQYILLYGGIQEMGGGGSVKGYVSISINDATPTDDDSQFMTSVNVHPVLRMNVKTLDNGGNNSVKMQYRTDNASNAIRMYSRYILALKIGN